MPTLDKLIIRDFRNIELQEMEFSPNVNCISGGNGEGKTNLLDSIWYLSMTKSLFSSSDKFNFRHSCREFALGGDYTLPYGRSTHIAVQVRDNGDKKMSRDGKPYGKISEHIGLLPIVTVSPSDTSMVSEGGEQRRKFFNSVLSQMRRAHLYDIQKYTRLLEQRNSLLRRGSADDALLDVIDESLSALAAPISKERAEFTEKLGPIVQRYYSQISGGKEHIDISYESDLQKGDLRDLLRSRREKDKMLGFTGAGVQKDDFVFSMDSFPIRKCGSQGQQKSFLVALKFAQYDLMKSSCAQSPILLLDDLFDKLDLDRAANLLKMVSGSDVGQIFISDTNKVRMQSLIDSVTSDRTYYEARSGAFRQL